MAETQAGKGALRLRPPAEPGRGRRHRDRGRQPARPRGRPRHRRRHPLDRLHHRLQDGLPGSRRPVRQHQRRRVRRRQAGGAAAGRRRPRGARRARARRSASESRRVERRAPRRRSWRGEWDAEVERACRRRTSRCPRRPGHRRGQRRCRRARRRGVRRRARCPATCTSCGGPATRGKGYHVEYGYSCMGYEIAGGHRRQAGRARPRGVRAGRRRLLPDAARRAGDRGRRSGIKLSSCWSQNHGYASIGALSRSVGSSGSAPHYRVRRRRAARRAAALGDGATRCRSTSPPTREPRRRVIRAATIDELRAGLADAQGADGPVVITSRPTATPACPATRAGGTCRWQRSQSEDEVRAARATLRAGPPRPARLPGGPR